FGATTIASGVPMPPTSWTECAPREAYGSPIFWPSTAQAGCRRALDRCTFAGLLLPAEVRVVRGPSRLLFLLGILPLAACSPKGGDEAADSGGTAETGDDGTVPMGAPAANLAIAKVTINQGVEVALFADGSNVSTLNTGLVEGRHALVRV